MKNSIEFSVLSVPSTSGFLLGSFLWFLLLIKLVDFFSINIPISFSCMCYLADLTELFKDDYFEKCSGNL